MKRVGCLYEQTAIWDNLKEAEATCCKRRMSNYGVRMHLKKRLRNLVDIQQMLLNRTIHTGDYKHE